MSVKVTGITSTKAELKRTVERTSDAERKLVRTYSDKIKVLAGKFAPVDEGFLENAIDTEENKTVGQRGRLSFQVGVNTDKLGPNFTQRGFPYHIQMHEDPENNAGNGPQSREKAARLGVNVGSKYMTRALDFYRDEIETKARELAKRQGRDTL